MSRCAHPRVWDGQTPRMSEDNTKIKTNYHTKYTSNHQKHHRQQQHQWHPHPHQNRHQQHQHRHHHRPRFPVCRVLRLWRIWLNHACRWLTGGWVRLNQLMCDVYTYVSAYMCALNGYIIVSFIVSLTVCAWLLREFTHPASTKQVLSGAADAVVMTFSLSALPSRDHRSALDNCHRSHEADRWERPPFLPTIHFPRNVSSLVFLRQPWSIPTCPVHPPGCSSQVHCCCSGTTVGASLTSYKIICGPTLFDSDG